MQFYRECSKVKRRRIRYLPNESLDKDVSK